MYSAKQRSSGSVSCQVGACCTILGGFVLCLAGILSTTEGNYENRSQDLGRDFAAVLLKTISWFERVTGGRGICRVKERTVGSICHMKQ